MADNCNEPRMSTGGERPFGRTSIQIRADLRPVISSDNLTPNLLVENWDFGTYSSDDDPDLLASEMDTETESDDNGSHVNFVNLQTRKSQCDNSGIDTQEIQESTPIEAQVNKYTFSFQRPFTSPLQIPFTGKKGLTKLPENTTPLDYFLLLANSSFFDIVLNASNAYGRNLSSQSKAPHSRMRYFKQIDSKEFQQFLALLFHMGSVKISKINDYWRKCKLFNVPLFPEYMSRNRFLQILRVLHFNSAESDNDRLTKLRPLLNFFNSLMDEIYYPGKELSIDESMVLRKGRLVFRPSLKNKRHKYGVKLYTMTEPNGLTLRFCIYMGGSDPDLDGTGHSMKVVMKLIEGKLNMGHSLYLDDYYNSVELADILMNEGTYCTGTLNRKKKNNPTAILSKKLKKGEVLEVFTENNICVLKWQDKREVIMISSEFDGTLTDVINRRGKLSKRPTAIANYNKYMGGIDSYDQMMSYYTWERKTIQWYKKIGIHIFQLMLLNSYHLFRQQENSNISYANFRNIVIEELLGDPVQRSLANIPNITGPHLPEFCPRSDKNRVLKKKCKVCTKNFKKRVESVYYCPKCPDAPGLCLKPCFAIHHSYE